jgi:hypothetical protein
MLGLPPVCLLTEVKQAAMLQRGNSRKRPVADISWVEIPQRSKPLTRSAISFVALLVSPVRQHLRANFCDVRHSAGATDTQTAACNPGNSVAVR